MKCEVAMVQRSEVPLVGGGRKSPRRARRAGITLLVSIGLLVAAMSITGVIDAPASGAATLTGTASHYEATTDPSTLLAQGETAGRAATRGLVILDFGRPAAQGSVLGTMDFRGGFVSLASIAAGVVSYIRAYFETAPRYTHLHVAIGTNDSCGTGQPCGRRECGCANEPPNFATWGGALADVVTQVQAQASGIRARAGYTDTITVMAGDDAEPAFDPAYGNTHQLLAGYADAVGGYEPAMVDYGSAEPGYWSEAELLQVAYGFAPDVAVPEVYSGRQASEWAALASYAAGRGEMLPFFGVLTLGGGRGANGAGYRSLLSAVQPITGQAEVQWLSAIAP